MSTAGYHVGHRTQGSVVMYLNSGDAHNQHEGTTSHFSFTFKDAIHTRAGEGVLVSLHSASIPYSFYNIRAGVNNTLDLESTTPFTITIPEGNYNVKTFGTTVTALILPNLGGGQTFSMEYEASSQKFKYTLGVGSDLVMKTGLSNSPFVEMGFEMADTTLDRVSTSYSTNIADINGSVHALYLRTNLPSKSVFESLSAGVSDVLDKIALNTNPGGIIVHHPRDRGVETLLETNHVRSLTCRLTDERNRLLNLNGLHFQFGLLFEFVELLTAIPRAVHPQQISPAPQQKITQSRQQQKNQRRKRALKRGKKKVNDAITKATKTPAPPEPQKQSSK